MSWPDLQGNCVVVSPSPVESDRFGHTMARVVVGQQAVWDDGLGRRLAAVAERDEEILVARWPVAMAECGAALAARRDVIPADTLIYWEVPSTDLAASAANMPAGMDVQGAEHVPVAVLADVVGRAFAGYVNHYAANPLLDPELALEGYVDWVRRTVEKSPGSAAVLLFDQEVVGMATWDEQPDSVLEILLAGLVPEAQGRRWYGFMLAEIGRTAVERDLRRVIISTQASTIAVQRAWARAGFVPMAAVTTVHAVRRGLLGL